MTLEHDALAARESGEPKRRPWAPPRTRRLATSEAENSVSIGPDAETVAS
jgi:hypothetical protein